MVVLVLPVLIPLLAGSLSLLVSRSLRWQQVLGVGGSALHLLATIWLFASVWSGGIIATHIGGWPAPYGITLVADYLSAVMLLLTGVVGFSVAVYASPVVDRARQSFGSTPCSTSLMGVSGAFLTGDLFNLYVWFEVMLIASFVLLTLGGERLQLEGGLKYVALNLIASALFLAGLGLLYGESGTLNMAHLSRLLPGVVPAGLVTTVSMLFLVAFSIKAAVFPLFFWLPDSYHTPPAAVSAVFSGLLTKVGVYALLRTFTLFFVQDVDYTHTIILVVAGFTMVSGVLGAVVQDGFRRILSFHIISQIGYMIFGLALYSVAGVAGSIFYITHHIIVKTNLFLVSGAAERLTGSHVLSRMGGLYRSQPVLAFLFLIPAMSLAGLPPLSGFFAKLMLIRAGLESGQIIMVAVVAAESLPPSSDSKIGRGFWAPPAAVPQPGGPAELGTMLAPIAWLALITVLLGVSAESLVAFSARAAENLMDPRLYIAAVLGG